MTLNELMFDDLIFSPFVVVFVRSKAYVRPHISDVVIMYVLVKGDVFKFIVRIRTKKWMVLCDSHQDWFYFVAMHKTRIPHANVMKKFRWERIQLCDFFAGTRLLVG